MELGPLEMCFFFVTHISMGVSKNSGTPKSSILIGFSIINHPFWGTPIFGNTHIHRLHSTSRTKKVMTTPSMTDSVNPIIEIFPKVTLNFLKVDERLV